jgi:hypothetical protein
MNALEQELREALARQATGAPVAPGMAERAVAGARRVRRRRTALTAAVAASVLVGALSVTPSLLGEGDSPAPAVSLTGPPRVPVLDEDGHVVDWPRGEQRVRSFAVESVFSAVPTGLLRHDTAGATLSLVPVDDPAPRTLLDGLQSAPGVSPDGDRVAAVVTDDGAQRLVEVEVSSGRVLRAVPLAPPLVRAGEDARVVGYSGDRVLIKVGSDNGPTWRAAMWEAGDENVIGVLEGLDGIVEVTDGVAATGWAEDGLCFDFVRLRDGGGTWQVCDVWGPRFSPDGDLVVMARQEGGQLEVRDAADGKRQLSLDVPPDVLVADWESNETLLYVTARAGGVDIVRCAVSSAECRTAASLPGADAHVLRHYGDVDEAGSAGAGS